MSLSFDEIDDLLSAVLCYAVFVAHASFSSSLHFFLTLHSFVSVFAFVYLFACLSGLVIVIIPSVRITIIIIIMIVRGNFRVEKVRIPIITQLFALSVSILLYSLSNNVSSPGVFR